MNALDELQRDLALSRLRLDRLEVLSKRQQEVFAREYARAECEDGCAFSSDPSPNPNYDQ